MYFNDETIIAKNKNKNKIYRSDEGHRILRIYLLYKKRDFNFVKNCQIRKKGINVELGIQKYSFNMIKLDLKGTRNFFESRCKQSY